jgi:hypothetical protein
MLNPAMAGNIEYPSDESLGSLFIYQRMAVSTCMVSIFDQPSIRLWPGQVLDIPAPFKGAS